MCLSEAIAVPSTTSMTMVPTSDGTRPVADTRTATAPPRLHHWIISYRPIVGRASDGINHAPVADDHSLWLVFVINCFWKDTRQHVHGVLHQRGHGQIIVLRCSSESYTHTAYKTIIRRVHAGARPHKAIVTVEHVPWPRKSKACTMNDSLSNACRTHPQRDRISTQALIWSQ